MRAATVVQVLQDLFYVLLHVLFYLWSLLNLQLTVRPRRMLPLAHVATSNNMAQVTVSTSHSSNVDDPRRLIQTAPEFDVGVIVWTAQSSRLQLRSVVGVRRSIVSNVLRGTQNTVAAGAKGGGHSPGRHFPGGGISRKIKKIRPLSCHLDALQLSISVHQRCSVTIKMHQIHLRPGLRPIRTPGSSPHSNLLRRQARRGGRTLYVCLKRHRLSHRHCQNNNYIA